MYHPRFRNLEAAYEAGCFFEFDTLPIGRQEEIVAWYISKKEKEAIDAYEANETAKREAQKGRRLSRGSGRRRR